MDKQINISIKTVVFAFALALAAYVVYRLRSVIGMFSISLLMVFSLEPLIKSIQKVTILNKKVGRGPAAIIAYIIFLSIFVIVFTLWLPPFITETQKLLKNLPKIVNNLNLNDKIDLSMSKIISPASTIPGSVLSATVSVFSNITALISIVILALYMSTDWLNIKQRFISLFSHKSQDIVEDIITQIEDSLGSWVKGELLLMVIVGTLSFIGFNLLQMDYALALGLIAGILEIVPIVGPILTAVIASAIALAVSPVKAFGVVVLCLIIQQLENSLIVPKVMQKVSGFSPLVILVSLMIGSEFFGIIGALVAIPVTMAAFIVFKHIFRYM